MLRSSLFAVLLLLTACEPTLAPIPTTAPLILPTPPSGFSTVWGEPVPVAQSATFDAPALAVSENTVLFGTFENIGGQPTLVVYRDGVRAVSDVSANRPFELSLFAGADNGAMAMWLDDDGSGIQKLYAARLTIDGLSPFGAIAVSSGAVTRYAAAAMPDGSFWTVWSTPVTGESALVGSRIDPEGRPRTPQPLRIDADFPALAVTQTGNTLIYWMDGARRNLYGAEVTDAGLTRIAEIAPAPLTLDAADQLLRLDAGIDPSHIYLFWQLRKGDGQTEALTLSAPLGGTTPQAARPLRLTVSTQPAQTGFNHGVAYAARYDAARNSAAWALPSSGQTAVLPVAVVLDNQLAAVYFQNGEPIAQQFIGALQKPLIAPPRIAADSERDLILAWWLPDTPQAAVLYTVQSR